MRIDEISPLIRDPQQLTVTAISDKTLRMQLSNYVLEFKGQFINTKFDYFFTLTCDFKDPKDITQIDFETFTLVNNYSQRVPQVNLTNINIPFTEDNCDLKTEGGVISKAV